MSSVPYSTPRPRDRISAMYDTKIINPLNNQILVWSNADQAWENANSSVLPPSAPQNLSQVLTVGNSATNQNINLVNDIRANEFQPYLPLLYDTPNSNSGGLYGFKIQTGSFNQNPLATPIPQAALQNALTGFPTEQTSFNLDNKSLNADTRIMSQFVDYTASVVLGAAATEYCLNFGSQSTGNDECFYDPMNMRVFYDTVLSRWIACGTPHPFNTNLIRGSWTITIYLMGAWSSPTPANSLLITLEHWRSGAFLLPYRVLQNHSPNSVNVVDTATYVMSGLYQDDWIPNTDEWRATIANGNAVQTFTIQKLNMTFEWRQLS